MSPVAVQMQKVVPSTIVTTSRPEVRDTGSPALKGVEFVM
jgi:hypothetical protein